MANAVASAWWQLRSTPSLVMALVKAHPPAGAWQSGTSREENTLTGTSALSVWFQWRAIPNVLGERTVMVTATSLANGETGVLVESQSDWVVLRPWSERIPAAVRRIKFSSVAPRGRSRSVALSVTRPSQVRAIVRLINSLPIAQPAIYFCPAHTDPRLITITFEAASGAPLAVLTYMDFRPWLSRSDGCKTIGLTIGGHPQRPLVGGDFLPTLMKLLGRPLI